MNRTHLILAAIGLFLAGGLAFPFLAGPTDNENLSINVTLVVSKDYGHEVLGRWEFNPSLGLPAMEMLKSVTDVETRYGGMFVYGIFGLRSDPSRKLDWLYYVDGVYMSKGLATYTPQMGEVVQIDYHFWGSYSSSPAFLSGYPAKIVYGVSGKTGNTTIIAPKGLWRSAKKLRDRLISWGARNVAVLDQTSATVQDLAENVIILSTPESASLYQEIQGWRKNAPWPSTYQDGKIRLNSVSGQEARELEEGCTVQCMYFPEKGVWALLIMATNRNWLDEGIRELNAGNSERYVAAFAISPSGTIRLPVS